MNETKYLYRWYKKLPILLAVIIAVATLLLCIADISLFSKLVGEGTQVYYVYGASESTSLVLVISLWSATGFILSILTYVLTAIVTSPVIIQTELLLKCEEQTTCNGKKNT